MAIKFPDSITQNNSNYITVSATDGDVQGIYFVANTTERDNIGDADVALDNHRVLGALVYVGTTPYLYQGVDISDAEWQNASNWAQTGSAVNALDDLSDVSLTAPSGGNVLVYDGANWVDGLTSLDNLSDVTITIPNVGDIIMWDGVSWDQTSLDSAVGSAGYIKGITASNLEDLADVVETTITTGDVLRWNGTNWVNYADSAYATSAQGALADSATQPGDNISTLTNDSAFISDITGESIGDLSDVTITAPGTGSILRHNGVGWIDIDMGTALGLEVLGSFGNVDTTGVTNGSLLQYNSFSAKWFDQSVSTVLGFGVLDDLSDVTETAITSGDVLRWNGSAWVNYADSNFAAASHTHTASEVTDFETEVDTILGGTQLSELAGAISETANHIVFYDGAGWSSTTLPVLATAFLELNDLKDVVETTITTGDVLRWNGTNWVNYADSNFAAASHTHVAADVTDFSAAADARIANAVTSDLSDVGPYISLTPLDLLMYTGSAWSNVTVSAALAQGDFSDLRDTNISGVTSGEVLKWDGTDWINNTLAEANISEVGHTHVASNISDFSTATTSVINATNIDALNNVIVAGATAGDILYDASGGTYANANFGVISNIYSTLTQHSDTSISGAASGEVLRYNGSNWVNAVLSPDDLDIITAGSIGDVMYYGASGWDSFPLSSLVSTPTLAQVTTAGSTAAVAMLTVGITDVVGINVVTSGTTSGFTATSSDATANYWPALTIQRNSASPADADSIGGIDFNGEDSASVETTYARIEAIMNDVTNTTEDGALKIQALVGGTMMDYIHVGDETYTAGGSTTISNVAGSNALALWNANNAASLSMTFDADTKTTASNSASINYVDGAGDTRNVMRMEDGLTILNNRTASSSVELRANNGTAGSAGEEILLQADTTNGITINEEYSLPLLDGTAGEVLETDGAGQLSFGKSKNITFFGRGLHVLTTSTDTFYRHCTSTTYPDYGNWTRHSSTTAPTSITRTAQYSKGGHTIPKTISDATIDIAINFSISASVSSDSSATEYNGDTVTFYVYDWPDGGTATLIGSFSDTFNGGVSYAEEIATVQYTGRSFTAGDNIHIVARCLTNASATRYFMMNYTINISY